MPATHRRTRLVGLVIVVTTVLSATGCGSKTQPAAVPSAAPPVPYVVKLATVTGRLSSPARKAVRARVGTVVRGWWQEAYLRPGATDVFAAFTPGAAKLARRDADLLSDPHRADGTVAPVRQLVDLDVLAVKGRAVGVTARIHLTYDRSATATSRCGVGGTVSLVPTGGVWRIFGYDVTRTCHPRKAGS
ncbi:MAG TPA: hypothetical protein VJ872_15255 [Nocardioides sp.]|nr:hypothetical protein [Nocardioides sp.]